MSLLQTAQYGEHHHCVNDRADLVWARALDQSVREVARLRGLAATGLTVEQEWEVSATLAAAIIALAEQIDHSTVDAAQLELVARTELAALDRYRRAALRR